MAQHFSLRARAHWNWWWAILPLALAVGCERPGATGTGDAGLKSFLPQAPPGWKTQQGSTEGLVAGSGKNAWAGYVPTEGDAQKTVDRVEVTLSVRNDRASKDKEHELRRLTFFGAQFLEPIEINGFKAMQSAPIYKEQVVSIFVSPRVTVDVAVFFKEKQVGVSGGPSAAQFTKQIDWSKLKELP